MKSNPMAVLGLMLLAGVLAGAPARAEDTAAPSCDVPTYLLSTESTLPKVANAVKAGHSP